MLASQIYVDLNELERNGLDITALQSYLENYQVGGKQAFLEVLTRQQVRALQSEYGIY